MTDIADKLTECKSPKERTERVDELARYHGVSTATIWRWANDGGYRARAERADKGKSTISQELLEIIAARVYISKRLGRNFTNTVTNACDQLSAEGYTIPCSISRVCKLLKEKGLDKKTLRTVPPHQKLISLHPNHVWQFDVTNCLKYHFNKNGMQERDADSEFYKNKVIENARKVERQLLRFVMIDHCSGAFFIWYYYAKGECAEDGADFFYKAFSSKSPLIQDNLGVEHTGAWQMHGVPKMLVSDKGSILRQKAIQNLMQCLEVDIQLHAAGNPRAKGGVEGFMAEVDEKFETILKIHNPETLAELNSWSLAWCIKYNQESVFRRTKNRANLWLKIRPEQLRLCPDNEVFRTLIHRPAIERTMTGNCQISYNGKIYSVPYTDWARQKVLVSTNAYEYPAINIHFNGLVRIEQPETLDEYGRISNKYFSTVYGEYAAMPETQNQKNIKTLEAVALDKFGIAHEGYMQKRRAVPVAVKPKQADEKVVSIKPRGTEIETPNIHAPLTAAPAVNPYSIAPAPNRERIITVHELIARLVREHGKLTVEQNKALKAKYPNGLTLSLADELINNTEEVLQLYA